ALRFWASMERRYNEEYATAAALNKGYTLRPGAVNPPASEDRVEQRQEAQEQDVPQRQTMEDVTATQDLAPPVEVDTMAAPDLDLEGAPIDTARAKEILRAPQRVEPDPGFEPVGLEGGKW